MEWIPLSSKANPIDYIVDESIWGKTGKIPETLMVSSYY